MAEGLQIQDGVTLDDRIQRFALDEFQGWTHTDNTNIIGPRRRARSIGAYRTPAKPMNQFDVNAALVDENTQRIDAARMTPSTLLGIFYSDIGDRRDWFAGEFRFDDVPQTFTDEISTTLTAMSATPAIESRPYGATGDFYYPNSGIVSGTAFSIGDVDVSDGLPVVVLDLQNAESLGGSPGIDVDLTLAGVTGSPWSVSVSGSIRAGIFVVNFNAAPEDVDLHPNVAHATAAQETAIRASTAPVAATIEITLNNFSGTRTDTVIDAYVGREMRRKGS